MKISGYAMAAGTFVPMLNTLSAILDKGAEHARAKGQDPDTLLNERLAPDMMPLSFQVRVACDQAKNAMAHLMGKEPPKFEDTEKTIGELKARIAKTLDYVKSANESAFAGAEDRRIEVDLQDPLVFRSNGFELLRDWIFPNFYFHLVTAYDILRHNGVELGKRDYMGASAGAHIRPRG